jgi:hypothetical protein
MTADANAEVVAWLADNGWRYRAAAKHFGLPYATVRDIGKAAKERGTVVFPGEAAPSHAPARPRARVERPDGEDLDESSEDIEPYTMVWDPTSCTREQFLVDAINRCLTAARQAQANRHGGVARQWETSAGSYRAELDRLREDQRREDEAKGRTADPDPAELCRRICKQAPVLARLAPDEARGLYAELGRALGKEKKRC